MRFAYLMLIAGGLVGCARSPVDGPVLLQVLDGSTRAPDAAQGEPGVDADTSDAPGGGANQAGGDGGGGATGASGASAGDASGGADDAGNDQGNTQGTGGDDAGPCDSTEADLENCGACGKACPASATSCASGLCQFQGCTWQAYAGDDYLFCFSKTGQSWEVARSFCQALDMDLTVIETSEENGFVGTHAVDAWIGASDLDSNGSWRWIVPGGARNGQNFWNGTSALYGNGMGVSGVLSDWSSTEPSGNPGEDCATLLSGDFWDNACWSEHGLVCEIVRSE